METPNKPVKTFDYKEEVEQGVSKTIHLWTYQGKEEEGGQTIGGRMRVRQIYISEVGQYNKQGSSVEK